MRNRVKIHLEEQVDPVCHLTRICQPALVRHRSYKEYQ